MTAIGTVTASLLFINTVPVFGQVESGTPSQDYQVITIEEGQVQPEPPTEPDQVITIEENQGKPKISPETTTSAEEAETLGKVKGGDVIRHDSIQNLIIAKDIRKSKAGYGGNCAIWNWDGGNSMHWVNPGSNCRTASMNGKTYSWTISKFWDTDAFTIQNEQYWVNMHGKWWIVPANVYTKITDIENAHCYRESYGVACYVTYENIVP